MHKSLWIQSSEVQYRSPDRWSSKCGGILLFVQVAEISLQALVNVLSVYNHIEMITGFDGIVKEISRIFGEY
jgi:hypothetical protein